MVWFGAQNGGKTQREGPKTVEIIIYASRRVILHLSDARTKKCDPK